MQIIFRCIQQRGHSLFFRLAIPQDLRHHFKGKLEISQTLDTRDPLTAFAKAELLRSEYKAKFNQLRGRQPCQTPSISLILPSELCVPIKPAEVKSTAPLLSEMLEETLVARNIKLKTMLDRKSAIRLLIGWHGDLPVSEYTRKMLIQFRDKGMLRLPTNVYHDKQYAHFSLKDLTGQKHAKTMTIRTVNNKLSHICTIFNYAVKHGYLKRIICGPAKK